MFVLIKGTDLIKGQKYKIDDYFTGYFKCPMEWDQLYYVFERISLPNHENSVFHCSPKYYSFYQYVSDNPREKMERRAVNRIVGRLIGDPYFNW